MTSPLITLTSDFAKQSQGVAHMEGVIYGINSNARVIHLMHGLPAFDLFAAARTMETLYYMPIGFHVCVVDPGVGTKRRALIVKVQRGDYLIGPDNGCLMSAPRFLGGIEKVVNISNEQYMLTPVDAIFHGRHIFAPAAAHLSLGVSMENFGDVLDPSELVVAPYPEAVISESGVEAMVIHVNHFGSPQLNILQKEWDKLGPEIGQNVELHFHDKKISLPFLRTFGDVPKNTPLILKDDYGRISLSLNMNSFADRYGVKVGDRIFLSFL